MIAYIARRLALLPLVLFGATLIIFLMLGFLTPGQRAALYVTSLPRDPSAVQRIVDRYGLDDPLPQQYVRWLRSVTRGDLGFSATGKEPVASVIRRHLPASLELSLWGLLPGLWIGMRLGIFAAERHNSRSDKALRIVGTVGANIPYFLVALMALLVFAAKLDWLPPGDRLSAQFQLVVDEAGWRTWTGMYTVDSLFNGRLDVFADAASHLVLPVLSGLAFGWVGLLRITRSSMLEALRQDYVRTARAKGLSETVAVRRHAWANARLPLVTIVVWWIVAMCGGQAMVESIFGFPGIGNRFIQAATSLDVITTLGLTLFATTVTIVGNLLMDVMYAHVDPRVRLN